MEHYDRAFYDEQARTTAGSAESVAHILMDLLSPRSVVDVGCGSGVWLSVFDELGVNTLGVDGEWAREHFRGKDPNQFMAVDLGQPFDLDRHFDLAISLEVAEHLPSSAAEHFVGSLTRLAPVVLFSAAIPGQGGVNHVNEQWPDYWKALFAERHYEMLDVIRPAVWDDESVLYHYAQNCFLFVETNRLRNDPKLLAAVRSQHPMPLRVVHAKNYLQKARFLDDPRMLAFVGCRMLLRALPIALKNAWKGATGLS